MAESALFKTKTVKIDTLGEYLKSVREQLNFEIKIVSTLSQIKPGYLEDLEAGNYAQLPAEVYLRGFLKSLAQLYGIKEQILIDQYEKERGLAPASGAIPKSQTQPFSLTPKILVLSLSILVGLVALFYIGGEVRSVLVPPLLEVSEPGSDTSVAGNSLVISGRAEVGADVTINDQAVRTDSRGQFTETLILRPGLNVVQVTARNKFGKTTVLTRQISSQTVAPKPSSPAAVNITVNVGPGSAWVYLEADGVVIQRGTMLSGSTKSVTAKTQIILTSANAGSTDVIYNSKDLGKLGREGEVIRNVEFSAQQ